MPIQFNPGNLNPEMLPQVLPGLMDYLQSGQVLGGMLGHTEESQKALYYAAYTYYEHGKYDDAIRIFGVLVLCDHWDRRYLQGMAGCLLMQRQYRDALKYYTIASMLDLTDPEPVTRAGECHLKMNDVPQARGSLEYGLTQARAHERHRHHVPKLEAMLALLDAQPAAGSPDNTKGTKR